VTIVRIVLADPRSGRVPEGSAVNGQQLIVLADDTGHRAVPLWTACSPHPLPAPTGFKHAHHPRPSGTRSASRPWPSRSAFTNPCRLRAVSADLAPIPVVRQ